MKTEKIRFEQLKSGDYVILPTEELEPMASRHAIGRISERRTILHNHKYFVFKHIYHREISKKLGTTEYYLHKEDKKEYTRIKRKEWE